MQAGGIEAVPEYEELLDELSKICGIVPEYCDTFGNCHPASADTKKAVLGAMGLSTATVEELRSSIAKKQNREWTLFVEPTLVILQTEQPLALSMHVPVREGDEEKISIQLALTDESGHKDLFAFTLETADIIERRVIDEIPHLKIRINLGIAKETGYYDLNSVYKSTDFAIEGYTRLIITPEACYMPEHMGPIPAEIPGQPDVQVKTKTWGLCLNLYALASGRNWGIGDFTDLREIGEWAAGLGCGFIGINPLHSIPNRPPAGISPYSPLSRLYKNHVYLDVESIPETISSDEAQALIKGADFQKTIEELRVSRTVDYEKIADIKERALQHAFDHFYDNHLLKDTPRAAGFKLYMAAEGELLEDYALFSAVQQRMKELEKPANWRDWPAEFHDKNSGQVQEFKKTHEKAMLCHKYLQWIIDGQHEEVCRRFSRAGMPIGLYQDLAVGSSDGGFDAWTARGLIAQGIDVGAPPDDFNPSGQNWGFPPMMPEQMKASGYAFLIRTIRKNMRHAGALRIDHALGMFRLFWIPRGVSAVEGAYVVYPSEDILRIIALESVRNKTIVIAEDLGTVGEDVRETLVRCRMLSYKLIYFERNYPDPSFKIPSRYTDLALCAVTTHDLPTLCGYLAGRDMEAKTRLALYPNEEMMLKQISERLRDKGLLFEALKKEGLLPDNFGANPETMEEMFPTFCLAVYEYLARTPCRLLAVNLDDIIGTMDQQNMPGTIDSYPNWIQKTPVSLEKIMVNSLFTAVSKVLGKNYR
jgi:4-alpha-glucanotransferase